MFDPEGIRVSATAPSAVTYPHIGQDAQGTPIVAGTTMKVVERVMAQRADGWSPEELCFQFPHLSMAEVHAALTYYWDHQIELDQDIERRSRVAEESRRQSVSSPLAQRLAFLKHRRCFHTERV